MSAEKQLQTNAKEPHIIPVSLAGKTVLKILTRDVVSRSEGAGCAAEQNTTPANKTGSLSSESPATSAWTGTSPLHSVVSPEEKNIFTSLSLNPDALSKLEEVLTTTNEGQQMLQQGLGHVASDESREDVMDESQLSLKIDESAVVQEDMDFELDDSMLQGVLNAGNLSAMASAFSDHAYATAPSNSTPVRPDRKIELNDPVKDSSIDGESELNTSRNEEDEQETADDSQEDGKSGARRGRGRRSGTRRSTRVQEISQRQEAKKIMEENLEKERAAIDNIRNLKPGDKIPVVKSYNMRGTRPRRDDGRIDYTKLAKGQGRVKLQDDETREETDEGGAYESGVDSVGGDSLISGNTDDSSLQASPLKIKLTLPVKLRTESDDDSMTPSVDLKTRGKGPRGRSKGLTRGRGRASTFRHSDDERKDEVSKPSRPQTSRRGSRGQGRGRGRGKKVTDVKRENEDTDSDDDKPILLLKQKLAGSEVDSGSNKGAHSDSVASSDSEADMHVQEKTKGRVQSSTSRDPVKSVRVEVVQTGEFDVVNEALPTTSSDTEANQEQSDDDDLPLNRLAEAAKAGSSKNRKPRGRKYEEDHDFEPEATQSSDEDAPDLSQEHSESVSPRKPGKVRKQGMQKVRLDKQPHFEVSSSTNEEEDTKSIASDFSTDEPNKLYCVCRKPWSNRFMICCEKCNDWFHGSCVGISEKDSKHKSYKNWNCPRCLKERMKSKKKLKQKEKSLASKEKVESNVDTDKVLAKPEKDNTEKQVKKPKKPEKATSAVPSTETTASEAIVVVSSQTEDSGEDADIQQTIDEIFGNSDEEEEQDEKDADFEQEAVKEQEVTKSKTATIVKKSQKNKEKIEELQKQLENVKAKRERKEQREKEREIVELEKKKEAERIEQAKRDLKRREKDKVKDAYVPSRERCVAAECKQRKLPDSVYCSTACIAKHADHSLHVLREERGKMFGLKPQGGGTERIVVLERQSGKIVTGPAAPTEATLQKWLEKHPSYEVLQPGQKAGLAPTALKKKEAKEKEDKRKEMQLVKEKRERREREAAEAKMKEQAEKEQRDREQREREVKYKESKPPAMHHHSKAVEESPPSSGPDPLRINVRKALKEGFDKRASMADDIMLSSGEIKRIALDIEEELFNYYGETSTKYRNKYRTILYYVRDPKNEGFFRRILNGRIKSHRLVRLNADQLGSLELARWKQDNPTVDLLESGLKFEKFDPPVKPAGSVQQSGPAYQKPKQHYEPAADILSSIIVDTTSSHKKHLFDVNCKICTGRQTDTAKAEARPEKKPKVEQPLAVETTVYSGYGSQYYNASPTSPASPAYPTATRTEHQHGHNIFGGDTGSGFYAGFYSSGKSPEEQAAAVAEQRRLSQGGKAEHPAPLKEKDQGENKTEASSRDPRKKGPAAPTAPAEAGKRDTQAGPVAEPLVDTVATTSSKALPPGCVWMGHLYVQDMCNLQCLATPVSGPTDSLSLLSEMPNTISVVGRLSPPQIWEYLERLRNSTTRGIVVMTLQPQLKDTLNYLGLFEYLRSRGRCGLMAQYSQKVKDFYLIPLASDTAVPSALMPFNGPGLEVNRPNLLLGVMVVILSKKPKELKPPVPSVEENNALEGTVVVSSIDSLQQQEDYRTHQCQVQSWGREVHLTEKAPLVDEKQRDSKREEEDKVEKSDLPKPDKPEKMEKDQTVPKQSEELIVPTAEEEELAAKSNDPIVKAYVKSSVTSETTEPVKEPKVSLAGSLPESLLKQLTQLKKPGTSKQEMAAAVVATLTANTQNKNIEEQKRLLAELTAKVEEQKKFLEKQKEKKQKPVESTATKKEPSAVTPADSKPPSEPVKNWDILACDIPLPESSAPYKPPKTAVMKKEDIPQEDDKGKELPKPERKSKSDVKPKLEAKTKSETEDKKPAVVKIEPAVVEQKTPVLSMSSLTFETKVETNAFNLARERLLKKSEDSKPVEPVPDTTAAPAANLVSLSESVQKLLSGSAFENLKNIVASVKDKTTEESGKPVAKTAKDKSLLTVTDREEGEIDDEEIDIDDELEAAMQSDHTRALRVDSPSRGEMILDVSKSETSVTSDGKVDSSQDSKDARERDRGSSVESFENRRDRRRRRRHEHRGSRDRSRDRKRHRSRSRDRRRHRSRSRDRHRRLRYFRTRSRERDRPRDRSRDRSRERSKEMSKVEEIKTSKACEGSSSPGKVQEWKKTAPLLDNKSSSDKSSQDLKNVKETQIIVGQTEPKSESKPVEKKSLSDRSKEDKEEPNRFPVVNPSGDIDYRSAHGIHRTEKIHGPGAIKDAQPATMIPDVDGSQQKRESPTPEQCELPAQEPMPPPPFGVPPGLLPRGVRPSPMSGDLPLPPLVGKFPPTHLPPPFHGEMARPPPPFSLQLPPPPTLSMRPPFTNVMPPPGMPPPPPRPPHGFVGFPSFKPGEPRPALAPVSLEEPEAAQPTSRKTLLPTPELSKTDAGGRECVTDSQQPGELDDKIAHIGRDVEHRPLDPRQGDEQSARSGRDFNQPGSDLDQRENIPRDKENARSKRDFNQSGSDLGCRQNQPGDEQSARSRRDFNQPGSELDRRQKEPGDEQNTRFRRDFNQPGNDLDLRQNSAGDKGSARSRREFNQPGSELDWRKIKPGDEQNTRSRRDFNQPGNDLDLRRINAGDEHNNHSRRDFNQSGSNNWHPPPNRMHDEPLYQPENLGFRREPEGPQAEEWHPPQRRDESRLFRQDREHFSSREMTPSDMEGWHPRTNNTRGTETRPFEGSGHSFMRDMDLPDRERWPSPGIPQANPPMYQDSDIRMSTGSTKPDSSNHDLLERFRKGEDVISFTHSGGDGKVTPVESRPVPSLFDIQVSAPPRRLGDGGPRDQSAGEPVKGVHRGPEERSDRSHKRRHGALESSLDKSSCPDRSQDPSSAPVKRSRFEDANDSVETKVSTSSKKKDAGMSSSATTNQNSSSVKVKEPTKRDDKSSSEKQEGTTTSQKLSSSSSKVKEPTKRDEKSSEKRDVDQSSTPVSSQSADSKPDDAKSRSANKKVKRVANKKDEYVFTEQDKLKLTPGVLGPFLSSLRGDDRKPEATSAKIQEVKQQSARKAPASTSKEKTGSKEETKEKVETSTNPQSERMCNEKKDKNGGSVAGTSGKIGGDDSESKDPKATTATSVKDRPTGWSAASDWSGKKAALSKIVGEDAEEKRSTTPVSSQEIKTAEVKEKGKEPTESKKVDASKDHPSEKVDKAGSSETKSGVDKKSVSSNSKNEEKTSSSGRDTATRAHASSEGVKATGEDRSTARQESRVRKRSRERRHSRERRRSRSPRERKTNRRSRSPGRRGRADEYRSFRERRFPSSPERRVPRRRTDHLPPPDNRPNLATAAAMDTNAHALSMTLRNIQPNDTDAYPDFVVKQLKAIRARANDDSAPPGDISLEGKQSVLGAGLLPTPRIQLGPPDNNVDVHHGAAVSSESMDTNLTSALLNRPPPDYYKNRNRQVEEQMQDIKHDVQGEIPGLLKQEFSVSEMQENHSRLRDSNPEDRPLHLDRRVAIPRRDSFQDEEPARWREKGPDSWHKHSGLPPPPERWQEGPSRITGLLGDRPPSHGSFEGFPETVQEGGVSEQPRKPEDRPARPLRDFAEDLRRRPEFPDKVIQGSSVPARLGHNVEQWDDHPRHREDSRRWENHGMFQDPRLRDDPPMGDDFRNREDPRRRVMENRDPQQRGFHSDDRRQSFPDGDRDRDVHNQQNRPLGAVFDDPRHRENPGEESENFNRDGRLPPPPAQDRRFPPDNNAQRDMHRPNFADFPPPLLPGRSQQESTGEDVRIVTRQLDNEALQAAPLGLPLHFQDGGPMISNQENMLDVQSPQLDSLEGGEMANFSRPPPRQGRGFRGMRRPGSRGRGGAPFRGRRMSRQ